AGEKRTAWRGAVHRHHRQSAGGGSQAGRQARRASPAARLLLRGWGHSGAPVPVPLNSTDPAARRCTVASTGGPAMYYIGIDVSTKESALCILDAKGQNRARDLGCRPILRLSPALSPPPGLP